jgi:B12-binding domain/radical SAM domain protein of rhizo-twelve system
LVGRGLKFGVQTRIDLWKPEMLELLGRAGCVSIEAGVESLTREGRDELAKNCKLETEELAERLVLAKRHVPFVQANLLEMPQDDAGLVGAWRDRLRAAGVWANDPVPLFPYPGSPDYRKLWGLPDDAAWERAVDHYLATFRDLSELQEARALPLRELEAVA